VAARDRSPGEMGTAAARVDILDRLSEILAGKSADGERVPPAILSSNSDPTRTPKALFRRIGKAVASPRISGAPARVWLESLSNPFFA
jgi:hypothetical protein